VPGPMPGYMAASAFQVQSMGFTPPLFPTSMFPSLSGMAATPPVAPKEQEHARRREEDDLLEVGALLVLLRLLSG